MAQVRMRDGHSIYVRTVGRGEPCVLVHGFASDGNSWLPFIAPLLHRYRFIIPDLRGFGRSGAVPLAGDCPLTSYARDLHDLAASAQLTRVPIVGISMGALSTAQAYRLGEANRFGKYMHIDQGPVIKNGPGYAHGLLGEAQHGFFERMGQVVAIASSLPSHQLSYRTLGAPALRQMALVFSEFAGAAFTRASVRGAVQALAGEPRLLRLFLPEVGLSTYLTIMRAYLEREYDLRSAFEQVHVPLHVVVGGASRMYPAAGQRDIARYAPHAHVEQLEGVGHMLPLEAPRRFLGALSRFLAA